MVELIQPTPIVDDNFWEKIDKGIIVSQYWSGEST